MSSDRACSARIRWPSKTQPAETRVRFVALILLSIVFGRCYRCRFLRFSPQLGGSPTRLATGVHAWKTESLRVDRPPFRVRKLRRERKAVCGRRPQKQSVRSTTAQWAVGLRSRLSPTLGGRGTGHRPTVWEKRPPSRPRGRARLRRGARMDGAWPIAA